MSFYWTVHWNNYKSIGQPDAGLTRDYVNSNLHRFKKPGSKNYLYVFNSHIDNQLKMESNL